MAYAHVGGNAIFQELIDWSVENLIVKHKSYIHNKAYIFEIKFNKPALREVTFDDPDCVCDCSTVERMEFQSANFTTNAFGKNMPNLRYVYTDNYGDNYDTDEISRYVHPDVKPGFKWDATTQSYFTHNYRYTKNSNNNWSKERI